MASVRKREWTHNGEAKTAWVVAYTDGGGKRRLKTFEKKKDADKYRTQVEVEIEGGSHVSFSETIKISDLIARYEADFFARAEQRRGVGSPYAIMSAQILHKHVEPTLGAKRLSELTTSDVEEWLNSLTRSGLKPWSIRNIAETLKRFVDYGVKKKHASQNVARVAVREYRIPKPDPIRTLSQEEVVSLLRSVDTAKRRGLTPRLKLQFRLFVHIAAFCGLRVGEIIGLSIPNIDLSNGTLRVRHSVERRSRRVKNPKTRAGVRDVPMPQHIAEMLGEWIEKYYRSNEGQLLFVTINGLPVAQNSLWQTWQKHLDRTGLGGKEIHFHALRHFAASNMIASGLPITDVAGILGHSKFDMTLQVYAHPIVPGHHRRDAFDRMAQNLIPAETAALDATRMRQGPKVTQIA